MPCGTEIGDDVRRRCFGMQQAPTPSDCAYPFVRLFAVFAYTSCLSAFFSFNFSMSMPEVGTKSPIACVIAQMKLLHCAAIQQRFQDVPN